MVKILLGSDYFPKFVQEGVLFIDKSLLIKQVIDDGGEVLLITRPRRWGKSLDLSMLQHFLAASVINIPTKGLFDNLKIAAVENGRYMQYQGQYPVILLNLKDVQSETYDGAINKIRQNLSQLFDQFPELQTSDKLSQLMQKDYTDILLGNADHEQLENALKTLSACLYTHYGQKVYILIDEYDKPLNHAHYYDYFDRLSDFMKVFLSASLKTNVYLERGVMTGILRLSKANMLSGLNNLKEYNLLGDTYSQYFGFTEQEVVNAFHKAGLSHDVEKVKAWYNGYNIGGEVAYNPWSIASCIANNGRIQPYWVDTADNRLIEKCILGASAEIKQQAKQLIEGNSIEINIRPHVTFDNLQDDSIALWSLLLFSGYLRLDDINQVYDKGKLRCKVSIPNQEVMQLFFGFFTNWFDEKIGAEANTLQCLRDLLAGDVPAFTRLLRIYLINAASFHDTGAKSEMFYHGFVLALVVQLSDSHIIRSNRESGYGRYDVAILPKTAKDGELAVLLEFKQVKEEKNLEIAAKTALSQIEAKHYDHELKQCPYLKTIVRVGMAFSGKAVLSAYQTFDCATQTLTDVVICSYIPESF